MKRSMGWGLLVAGQLSLVVVSSAHADDQATAVTLLARQFFTNEYQAELPGRSSGRSTATATCSNIGTMTSCSGSGESSGTTVPPRVTYSEAHGAILALQAPDGRVAVVRCVSKYAPRGDGINQRSCRIPSQRHFTAEFKGEKAKLRWASGWDQKKIQSETYDLLQGLTREDWVNRVRERARARGAEILDDSGQ